jgi:hypothetical protein
MGPIATIAKSLGICILVVFTKSVKLTVFISHLPYLGGGGSCTLINTSIFRTGLSAAGLHSMPFTAGDRSIFCVSPTEYIGL